MAMGASQAIWSPGWLIVILALFCSLVFRDFGGTTKGVRAPIVGRWPFEPYFLTGLRFKRSSMLHLGEGYKKNLYGKSTTTDILLKSNLQARVLRAQLTQNLPNLVASSLEEIEYATERELPTSQGTNAALSSLPPLPNRNTDKGTSGTDEWKSIKINHALLYVVAGVTTRAISGSQLCRKRDWLSTCIKYTENIFITVLILRLFPRVFHEWISGFLPSSWITHISLRRAKKLLVPIIEERQRQQASGNEGYEKPLDLLQYMIEGARGDDLEPGRLAHLQLMVNLAGIHTTSAAITHTIYDLCEHPEYKEELREEVEEVLQSDGGWQKDTYKKLVKLDSFLKESQRFSPPTLRQYTLHW
ncbi:MAG: hypothetical protein LQ338_002191 [Usnochroma carphineum]|nr:MAG: hypothetical protein LQ338_002191 [Usnochroma carphineum]